MPVPRQIPLYDTHELTPKSSKNCIIVTTWNEGDRLRKQLERMQKNLHLADIIIVDYQSNDGSTDESFLKQMNVRSLLVTSERGLSSALRVAIAYALDQNYEFIFTVDGNNKDGVESLPDFIKTLDNGYDFVQGSRYLKGGYSINTPWERYLGIRLILSPIMFLGSHFFYTDATNGFKGMKAEFLRDPRVQPLRNEFVRFNLQLYFNYRVARLGFKIKEIPVSRVYPKGENPTKITSHKLVWIFVWEMIKVVCGTYNPKPLKSHKITRSKIIDQVDN